MFLGYVSPDHCTVICISGSYGILQTTPQFLMNVLDLGMTVQQSIEAPRMMVIRAHKVEMEDIFPSHVQKSLGSLGHELEIIEAWSKGVGGAQGIMIDREHGTFQGAADPRRDGFTLGW